MGVGGSAGSEDDSAPHDSTGGVAKSSTDGDHAEDERQEAAHEGADDELDDEEADGDEEEDDEDGAVDESILRDRKRLWKTIHDRPCHVAEILVTGNTRTRQDVVVRELREAMAAKKFGEMNAKLVEGYNALQSLGIFEEINLFVDSGPDDVAGTATVHVDVVERGIFSANIGTYVQGKEQTVEVKGTLKNLFGYAESVDVHVGTGANSSSPNAFSLGLVWPRALYRLAAPPPTEKDSVRGIPVGSFLRSATLEARLAESTRSWKEYSGHSERSLGPIISLANGPHQLAYSLLWRENWGVPDNASCSPAVRRELGHSLLSSLKYEYVLDRRDSRARPARGYYLRAASELAGMGTDPNLVRFFRQEVEVACFKRLHRPSRTSIAAGFHVGALFPWTMTRGDTREDDFSASGRPPLINDRFFLGGPSSLRGFRLHGVGPADWRSRNSSEPAESAESSVDFLGGDLVASASVGLGFDLPLRKLREVGVHGHIFTSVGSLVPAAALELGGGVRDIPSGISSWVTKAGEHLRAGLRWSAGAGLVWPTVFGRLEANYTVTLQRRRNDVVPKHGLQLGINTSPY